MATIGSSQDVSVPASFLSGLWRSCSIERYRQKLRDLQYLIYAEDKRSLLICLQGRDATGKDGTINHVLGAMNPQGCSVTGFKVPSTKEAAHDFLWRYHRAGQGADRHFQSLPL